MNKVMRLDFMRSNNIRIYSVYAALRGSFFIKATNKSLKTISNLYKIN